jgi:hypothetical protein
MTLLWDYIETKLPKPLTWEQLQQKWREQARKEEEIRWRYRHVIEQQHQKLLEESERLADLQNAVEFGY